MKIQRKRLASKLKQFILFFIISLPNIEAKETRGCFLSTLKVAVVFVLTRGYHKPAALIIERSLFPLVLNSCKSIPPDPHSARVLFKDNIVYTKNIG